MLNNKVNFGFSIMIQLLDFAHENLVSIPGWACSWEFRVGRNIEFFFRYY